MDTLVRNQYVARVEKELRENILPFWMRHTIDRAQGGFFGEVRGNLEPDAEAERGALLSSRILWTYSSAFRHYREPAYADMARWAFEDLSKRFWDADNGGWFWSTSAAGRPLRTRKQIYGQAFGMYAHSEFYRATGDRDALARAIEVFRLVEKHARDPEFGGYFEACTREWVLEQDFRLSDIDMNEPKSQNTLLHVMEAYTNLLKVWPDAALLAAQHELIEIMLNRVLDRRTYHLGLFFDVEWTRRTERISFGHDIEAAWLLHEAATSVGDVHQVARVRDVAVNIARVTLAEAIDDDGGLLYEADKNGITNDIKEWWPQAEAAVGFLDAYQISGDEKYLTTSLRLWDFIEENLVDREKGEWYRSVTRERVKDPAQSKASFWKCPYHNGRACMEMADRLKTL
jgi:cellobiose epimerase